jgi:DNA excision repair protein ERCC-3
MPPKPDNALIVQSDSSILLDTHAPRAGQARAALAPFAELIKSPEHVHTFRLTPLSIWNARASGLSAARMVEALREHARYAVPPGVEQEILELAARYGRVVIALDGAFLLCTCSDEATAERLSRDRETSSFLGMRVDSVSFLPVRIGARRQRGRRSSLRSRQDYRRNGGDGTGRADNARAYHQCDRGPAMAPRTPGQNNAPFR